MALCLWIFQSRTFHVNCTVVGLSCLLLAPGLTSPVGVYNMPPSFLRMACGTGRGETARGWLLCPSGPGPHCCPPGLWHGLCSWCAHCCIWPSCRASCWILLYSLSLTFSCLSGSFPPTLASQVDLNAGGLPAIASPDASTL